MSETPRIGSTVYEIATGEPWAVIGTSGYLRSRDGRLRRYTPKAFRRRRDPNDVSEEAVASRNERERAAAVAKYGERIVELAEANNLSPRQAAEACR